MGNDGAIHGLFLSLELLWITLGNCLQCWGHLGVIFGGLGRYLGPPWGCLGSCWGYVGATNCDCGGGTEKEHFKRTDMESSTPPSAPMLIHQMRLVNCIGGVGCLFANSHVLSFHSFACPLVCAFVRTSNSTWLPDNIPNQLSLLSFWGVIWDDSSPSYDPRVLDALGWATRQTGRPPLGVMLGI